MVSKKMELRSSFAGELTMIYDVEERNRVQVSFPSREPCGGRRDFPLARCLFSSVVPR